MKVLVFIVAWKVSRSRIEQMHLFHTNNTTQHTKFEYPVHRTPAREPDFSTYTGS